MNIINHSSPYKRNDRENWSNAHATTATSNENHIFFLFQFSISFCMQIANLWLLFEYSCCKRNESLH